jgi:hypothetical protein
VKIKLVVIDFETPRWARKLAAFAVPLVVVLGLATVVFATPHQWKTSDTLQADDLNGLNVVTKGGVKYSVGATTYCGTGTATTGAISAPNGKNGYAGAKALCEASSGCGSSPTAHQCSSEELLRSIQMGVAVPTGWYSALVAGDVMSGSYSYTMADCQGWSMASSAYYGPTWYVPASGPATASRENCSISHPVLCCD